MNSPEKTGKRPGKMLLLFLEVLLWVNGLILLLAVVAGIAFQLPAVQTFAAQKATVFLASRLQTKVSIGRFTTDWRNSIVLKEIYIEDQHRDTLLYAGRLGLDLSIFGLKRNRLSIRSASIEDGRLNIHSSLADSAYNFSFISAAFNGKKPGAETGNATAFSFKLRNLKLKNVRLNLSDPIKGNFGKATIGNFTAQLEEFDTAKPGYHLGSLKLENTAVKWKKTKAPVSTKKPQNRQFTFKKIRLKNTRFHWLDLPAARRVVARIGNAEVNADKIALPDARADLSQISLENSDLAVYRLKALPADTTQLNPEPDLQQSVGKEPNGKAGNLAVWVKEIKFKKVAFRYRNFNVPARSRGFDLADLDMTGVNFGLRNLYYSQKSITAALENMQLKEKSGFRIRALKGSLKANASGFSLQDFELKTNGSLIRSGIEMEFMPAQGNKPVKTAISVNFRHAKLVPQDILYLLPDLRGKPFFRKLGNRKLLLNGTISGFTTDLAFRNFEVNGWTGTRLHFSGNVKEITNPERRLLNLKISKLTTNRNDLNLLLAGEGGKAKIRFPAQVSLSGNVLSRQDFLKLDNFRLAASNGTAIQTSGTISGKPASKY
ncbi:MAG TPA: hypothetical protein VK927_11210, partial [Adhaeribacter sp.]|nr:hypothetical protein [Adhaeribacter sp.]